MAGDREKGYWRRVRERAWADLWAKDSRVANLMVLALWLASSYGVSSVSVPMAFILLALFLPYRVLVTGNNLWEEAQSQIKELKAKNLELQERLEPKLELVFDEGEPYRQDPPNVAMINGNSFVNVRQVMFRVGVKTRGTETINNVSVRLENIEPKVMLVPLKLHLKDDNPNTPELYQTEFPVHPGPPQYIDVVYKTDITNLCIDN